MKSLGIMTTGSWYTFTHSSFVEILFIVYSIYWSMTGQHDDDDEKGLHGTGGWSSAVNNE